MSRLETTWSHAALFALVLATGLAAPLAHADEPKPDNQLSYNIGAVSDYRYRGLSQSRLDPALQGGADYVHNPTGFYAGTWLSTIRWTKDLGGSGDVEWDLYGGKKGQLTDDISYDLGGLYYWYPSNGLTPNANTFELYGQLGYGPGYIKYSHSTTNLFGTPNSRSSGYLDVGATFELPQGFGLVLHAGRQEVRHNDALSYNDYKVGVTKDVVGFTVGLAYIKASTNAYLSPAGKNLGKSAAQLSVLKTF
jgi:uncharacterized protein (TIGR02001 family)